MGDSFWLTKQLVLASVGIERAGPRGTNHPTTSELFSTMMNRPAFCLTVEYSHQIGTKVEKTADDQPSLDPKSVFYMYTLKCAWHVSREHLPVPAPCPPRPGLPCSP